MSAIPPNEAIKAALTAPRMLTYEVATTAPDNLQGALNLYAWNAQVSAAMLAPLHILEVVVRNCVSDAIAAVYGSNWPWSPGFEASLPTPHPGVYSARRDLQAARAGVNTVGRVIPELKFIFWQSMFTSRNDHRLWKPHLRAVMPFLNPAATASQHRAMIYAELEQLRKLRNRIAHHEPIITRNLADDFQKIQDLIAFRCPVTALWMVQTQAAQALILTKPP